MNIKYAAFASILLASTAAQADGMAKTAKPLVIPAQIDKTLTEPAPAAAAAPIIVPPPAPEDKAVITAPATPAPAETTTTAAVPEERTLEVQPENPAFFGMSVGMYDAVTHGKQAAALNLEFRPALKLANILQPLVGVIATTNATTMAYAGIGVPLRVGGHLTMLPSVSIGAYDKGDADKGVDLGQTLAYRVGTELAYEFDNKSRVGLNFHALTNGKSFGREDRTEVFSLAYTMPITPYSGEEAAPQEGVAPPVPQTAQ